jgi:hypothetical protein
MEYMLCDNYNILDVLSVHPMVLLLAVVKLALMAVVETLPFL